ncbi:MAG: ABC transporter permease subunit [Planctomycetota bacterium]
MSGGLRVFRTEWYRLTHGRVAAGAALFLAAVSALRVYAAYLADQARYADTVRRALSQGREVPALPGPGNAWEPFVDGFGTGLTVGTLLLLIASARAVAGDRENGLLRVARTRSASRSGLVVGRALQGLVLVLATMTVTGLASWGAASALYDFGPVIEDNYELVASEELHLQFRIALLATLAPLLGTWAWGLAVSAAVRTGTGAVSAALASYLAFDLFKGVLGESKYWVFAAFNPSFVDDSFLKQLSGIARGLSDAGYSEALLRQNLLLPWPQTALLLVLAGWITSRRAL